MLHTQKHLFLQEVAQATEALQAVHRQQTLWLKVKTAMLAGHARHVRQELAKQTSAKAELEVAAMQQQVAGLEELLQQQQEFAHTLEQVCQVRLSPKKLLFLSRQDLLSSSSSSRKLHAPWSRSAG